MRLRTTLGGEEERPEEDATRGTVRSALYMPELWYGTEFELRPSDPTAPRLSAVAVSSAYAGPDGEAEFLLGLEERGVHYGVAREPRFSREAVCAYLERVVDGDATWIDELSWIEVSGGRGTGRHRTPAV